MSMLSKSIAMVAVSGGLMLTAASASATTFLSDSLGTLVINLVTDTGSLSAATTLFYANTPAVYKTVKGKQVLVKPAASALAYSFGTGGSGVLPGISPAAFAATQIDYTFKIAAPVNLLYGQVLNTVQGNKVALGAGTIQLWDLTTTTSLTPLVHLSQTGVTNEATTTLYSIDLRDTSKLYALRVIGAVPVRTASKPLINVQYSPSMFATAVPEPATWSMMILGVGGVAAALRRRSVNSTSIAS